MRRDQVNLGGLGTGERRRRGSGRLTETFRCGRTGVRSYKREKMLWRKQKFKKRRGHASSEGEREA